MGVGGGGGHQIINHRRKGGGSLGLGFRDYDVSGIRVGFLIITWDLGIILVLARKSIKNTIFRPKISVIFFGVHYRFKERVSRDYSLNSSPRILVH
jgi:hypothetical protein